MSARWLKRDRDREDADDVDLRIERQARRAGRSVEEEQEAILRDVLPNVRRSVAEAGLTIGQYLQLNRVEYHDLLASNPTPRTLLGRRHGLLDYDSFVRLRRWIEEAAERAGEDAETWATRSRAGGPPRPWDRRRPAGSGSAAGPDVAAPATAAPGRTDDDPLLDRLERLAALRDSGALTDAEFQTQKRRLLDGEQ